jgi:hypothetical protein
MDPIREVQILIDEIQLLIEKDLLEDMRWGE